jgi:hypothetical protein
MNYNGKNSTKPLRYLFQERAKWYGAFRDEDNEFVHPSYLETNIFELVFYQRINKRFETIIPNTHYIKSVSYPGMSQPIIGLPFAVDAIKQFSFEMTAEVNSNNNLIQNDAYLSAPVVYRSYSSPIPNYQSYMSEVISFFIEHIKTNKLHSSITHFGDFVNLFISFLKINNHRFPITLSAWQKSVNSNIFSSGLAFSVAPLDCSNDVLKEEFINSPNYETYLGIANQNGFFVSAGCPWILIAGTKSELLLDKFVKKTGEERYKNENDKFITVSNENSIYENFFNKTYIYDINYIKNILYNNYNNYIELFQSYKKVYFDGNKTTQSNILREPITMSELEQKYKDIYWLLLYVDIRNIEEDHMYDKATIDKMKQKTIFFEKKLDYSTALGYINDQYRFFFVYNDGGSNEYLRNLQSEE